MATEYADITPGSGQKVAGDSDGTGLHQSMKLMLGSDGNFTGWLTGDAVLGAHVSPRRKVVRVSDTVSGITTGADYAANDQVGALQSVSSALRTSALTGTITNVVVVDADDVMPTTAGIDLYIWESDPTLASDNAGGPGVSDSDLLKLVAKIEMPAFRDEGSNRSSTWMGACDVVSSDASLRYSYVTRGPIGSGSGFATQALTAVFTIVQD